MPDSCCAVGCSNRRTGANKELPFYRIPAGRTLIEQRRRAIWLKNIRRKNWSESQITNAKICGAHFTKGGEGTVFQESGIRNILLSPMASNIKYTMYSIHVTNEQKYQIKCKTVMTWPWARGTPTKTAACSRWHRSHPIRFKIKLSRLLWWLTKRK